MNRRRALCATAFLLLILARGRCREFTPEEISAFCFLTYETCGEECENPCSSSSSSCGEECDPEGNSIIKLDLAETNTSEIPTSIKLFINITELNLSNNSIGIIPDELFELKNLRTLDLSNNAIDNLPDLFEGLTDLNEFSITGNNLLTLPPSLLALGSLTSLSITNNFLNCTDLIETAWSDVCGEQYTCREFSKNTCNEYPTRCDWYEEECLMQNTTFTISFEADGTCSPENIIAVYGKNITLPNCTSEDLVFYGWYEDPDNTILFNRTTMPGRDVTLHGVYVSAEYLKFCEFSSGWCSAADCVNPCNGLCGASCDDDGHITAISAANKGNTLVDLPSELVSLKNLHSLSLEGNQIDVIPAIIMSLTPLTNLTLKNNNITIVPSNISNLTNLVELNLSNNSIAVIPDELFELKNLRTLDLSNNNIDNLPDLFEGLIDLNEFSIAGNILLTLPPSLLTLGNLTSLSITNNFLNCTDLIETAWNDVCGEQYTCREFSKNTCNEYPTRCDWYEEECLMQNTTFTISFEADGTCSPENITAVYGKNITLPNCTSEDLVFYGWYEDPDNTILFNRTTMPGRDVILHGVYASAEYLKFCEFSSGWCSAADCVNPCNGLCGASCDDDGHITAISAANKGNALVDLPSELIDLPNLRSLSLEGNQIDAIPAVIMSLVPLTNLTLKNNNITIVSSNISNLTNLVELNLNNNSIGIIPDELFELKNLRTLDLSNNAIDNLPDLFEGLIDLNEFFIAGNILLALPPSLLALGNLTSLSITNNFLNCTELIETAWNDVCGEQYTCREFSKNTCNEYPTRCDWYEEECLMQNTTFTISFEADGTCSPENITAVYGKNITLPNCTSEDLVFYGWYEDPDNTILFNRTTMPGRDVILHGVYASAEYLKFCEFSSGWCSAADCVNPCNGLCGASCDDDGHITAISAANKGLSSLGEVISSFTYLEQLDLSGNILIDLPSELVSLKNLHSLSLEGNQINTIPAIIMSLVPLTNLTLKNNNITIVPSNISNLTNLVELDLSYNILTNLTDSICDIKNLTVLNIQYNFLDCSSSSVPYCAKASCFNQSVCSDFGQNLCKERYHSLCSWNSIFEICTDELLEERLESSMFCEVTQGHCKKDNCLDPCNGVCGASCEDGVITSFDGSGMGLTYLPEEFGTDAHFHSIESLDLSGNRLSSLPGSVEFMSNLSRVYLSGNEFSVFPNLIFIYNDESSSVPPPAALSSSSSVFYHSSLILRDVDDENENGETDAVSSGSSSTTTTTSSSSSSSSSSTSGSGFMPFKLRELYLNDNNLTEIPNNINGLKYLTSLDLSGNSIQELPNNFGALVRLTHLDLSNNSIRELPGRMKKLTGLSYLRLSENYLDCRKYTVKNGWPAIFGESCDQDEQFYEVPKSDKSWVMTVIFIAVGAIGFAVILVVVLVVVLQVRKCIKNRPQKDRSEKPLIKKKEPKAEEPEGEKSTKKEEKQTGGPIKLLNMTNMHKDKNIEKMQADEPIGRALCRRAPPRMDCESITERDIGTCALSGFTGLYNSTYQRLRIHDAGIEAGLRADQAVRISKTCSEHMQKYVSRHALPAYLSEEDVEGIAMYTYEFDPKSRECNPERLINTALFTRKFDNISKVRSLMYIVLSSMRKLPLYKGRMLFRGVRESAKIDVLQYYEGNTVSWPEITSATKNIEVVKAFLTEAYNRPPGKSKNLCTTARGTIFIIDNGWGYDIQEYSLTPEYEEVVIEPDRQFVVKSIIPGDVTMIYLEMINTPVALESKMPVAFGDDIVSVALSMSSGGKSKRKSEHGSKKKSTKSSSSSSSGKRKHEDNDDKEVRIDVNNDMVDSDECGGEKAGLVQETTKSKKHSFFRRNKKSSNDNDEKDKKKKSKKKEKEKEKKEKEKEKGKSSKLNKKRKK